MTFRTLTALNDWTFGRGSNNYATDNAAISLNIKTRLQSWVSDCFFDLQAGIDWSSRLDVGQQAALVEEIKGNILRAYGVVGINSVNANYDSRTRDITIRYNIQTIFSPSFQDVIKQGAGSLLS